jgi:hypothetical protein
MKLVALIMACAAATAMPCSAQSDVSPRMREWSRALGVPCTHCHVAGQWSDRSKATFDFAQRMMRMVDGLNAGPLNGVGAVSCWTCHRGQSIPARLPRASWESVLAARQGEFDGQQNRALTMSVYAASLGVECSHCHEDRDRAADTKPPKAMVAKMLPIFDEIPKYFDTARKPTTQCYMCHQGHVKPAE